MMRRRDAGILRARIFVASSSEQLELAKAVQENLEHQAEVTLWSQGTFRPSQYPLENLQRAAAASDAGVFVLAPDDLVSIRGKRFESVRDNVLFELGLFIGALGRRRAFLIPILDTFKSEVLRLQTLTAAYFV